MLKDTNIAFLEIYRTKDENSEAIASFWKEHVKTKSSKIKILGVYWHKQKQISDLALRPWVDDKGSLKVMKSGYNPLGFASRVLLVVKQFFLRDLWSHDLMGQIDSYRLCKEHFGLVNIITWHDNITKKFNKTKLEDSRNWIARIWKVW